MYKPIRQILPQTPVPSWIILLIAINIGSIFITQVKLIPGIRNNFTVFDATACLLLVSFAAWALHNRITVRFPLISGILLVNFLLALPGILVVSSQPDRLQNALLQTFTLLLWSSYIVSFSSIISQKPDLLLFSLKCLTLCTLFICSWVILDKLRYRTYSAETSSSFIVGPFRNRAHMGIYMLGGFWIVMIFSSLPNIAKRWRLAALTALPLLIYSISTSGRRSVYAGFAIGLVLAISGVAILSRENRRRMIFNIIILSTFLGSLYMVASPYIPDLDFFERRILMVDDRLRTGLGIEEDSEDLIALQQRGAIEGFKDYPLFGIGWGGYYGSAYSPTGHEMHSTPFRYFVELGIVGVILYLAINVTLIANAFWDFMRARGTNLEITTFIVWAGLCSVTASQFYNRSLTDRSYWLLIVVHVAISNWVTQLDKNVVSVHGTQTPRRDKWSDCNVQLAPLANHHR